MKRYPLPRRGDDFGSVILCDGVYPEGEAALDALASGSVVCCDGAADKYIADGGLPVAIVGDCDSVGEDVRERYGDILHADPDQNINDLTKAVRFCLGRGAKKITVVGATGKREDHTLGNISLLAEYMDLVEIQMITDTGIFTPIIGWAEFESFSGQQVSIFVPDSASGVRYDGLKYPVPEEGLKNWWCGTLNEALGSDFRIYSSNKALIYRVL